MYRAVLLLVLLLFMTRVEAQQGVTTFGLQLKPVIPLEFFGPLTTVQRPELQGTIELQGGLAFGMNIRVGITNAVSIETGIGQITRRYSFSLNNDTSGFFGEDVVRYVGYEIPITGLVYIRLGERTWMNSALGFSLDMYPSDVQRDLENGRIYIYRNNWAQFGVLGNMGVEYRTEKSGTFYLGATYHQPFNPMATVDLTYASSANNFFPYVMRTDLEGGYLTVDLRYYFHEDPERHRRRRPR
jgi:hypothetical protein